MPAVLGLIYSCHVLSLVANYRKLFYSLTSLVMSTVHVIFVHTVQANDALTVSHYCIKKHILHPCFISDRPSSQSSVDLILLTTRPFLLNTMHCPIHKILSASAPSKCQLASVRCMLTVSRLRLVNTFDIRYVCHKFIRNQTA